jgi:threonine dehydrogenase-like Zn-dependent dehydrogenase
MPETCRAAVVTAPGVTEVMELPVPDIGDDAGLLRVEAAGICGSDVGMYAQRGKQPRILGHENVGTIVRLGRVAAERWGVAVGDRVAVEEYLPCGHCRWCRGRDFRLCEEVDAFSNPDAKRFGGTPISEGPGLWGGYSEYLYLDPRTIIHQVPAGCSPRELAMALPIGNGFEWAHFYGGAEPGKTVVVFGPGQQGLGCVVSAKESGAECVILIGLERDAERLEVGRALGADVTLTVSGDEAVAAVDRVTGGALADVVIDTAAGSSATVLPGIKMLGKQGRLVLPTGDPAGIKDLPVRQITSKCLRVQGARGHSFEAVELAIALIASKRRPLDLMSTHSFGLDQVDTALRYMAGDGPPSALHLTVCPGGDA